MVAFDMPPPRRIKHADVIQDQQKKCPDAQDIQIMTAGRGSIGQRVSLT
jgi:hypothetical protein